MPKINFQLAAAAVSALCLVGNAAAQIVPNAGSILRQLEPDRPNLPAPKADSAQEKAAAAVPAGPAIHVSAFRIEGNHRIPTAQIQQLLASYVNRDLSPADLRQATDSIAHLYSRTAGWRAYWCRPSESTTEIC